jgi:hypothetical protein
MLKTILTSVFILCLFTSCKKTKDSLSSLYQLDSNLGEISGMIRIGDRYFAHNDSGAEPIIYEINIKDGKVLREVYIENGINIDWEDIAVDSNFIYIGDIGGNNLDRDSLEIYKVKIEDLLSNDSVYSEVITITKNRNHPKDFEAMFVKEGSLFLFSKDLDNYICKTFKLDLSNTNLELGVAIEQIKLTVAITGADYNVLTNEASLIGYTKPDSGNLLNFKINILKVDSFQDQLFKNTANIKRYNIKNAVEVAQAESIVFSNNESKVYVSSEMNSLVPSSRAILFSFNLYK